jgi:hypothetical protein
MSVFKRRAHVGFERRATPVGPRPASGRATVAAAVLTVGLVASVGIFAAAIIAGGVASPGSLATISRKSSEQSQASAWMRFNLADPDFQIIEWSPLEPSARDPRSASLSVRTRCRTQFGGWRIVDLRFQFYDGELRLGMEWPFPTQERAAAAKNMRAIMDPNAWMGKSTASH